MNDRFLVVPALPSQVKAKLAAKKKASDAAAKKKAAMSAAALAEAKLRQAKAKKQKDVKAYNQVGLTLPSECEASV